MSVVALAILGWLAAVGQASSPAPQSDAPPLVAQQTDPATDLGTIDVTGQRPIEDRATAFVEEVAVAPRGRGLARWDAAICVGAANMTARYAQFMIDRVSTVAADLGLEIGEPGCRPNIMIAAAADADELATALVRDNPDGYRPAHNNTDLGSQALEAFQATDAPVRWWHVSLPVSVDTGNIAVRLNGEDATSIAVRDASRLRANVRDDLARVVIIIDTTRIGGVPNAALADYVALLALAQVDPSADSSAWPSVLNLFAGGEQRPSGLTDWDRDYLTSLYNAPRDRARSAQQAREIVRQMVDGQAERARTEEATSTAPGEPVPDRPIP